MGTLTREALREEVNKGLGDQLGGLSGSDLTDAQDRLNRALELTQTRMARRHCFTELYTSAVDSVTITGTLATDFQYTGLPSTLRKIHELIWTDPSNQLLQNRRLIEVPARQWAQFIGQDQELTGGDITHFSRWGSTLEWWKIPTENYDLIQRYSIWPSAFANDSAYSDLEEKDDIIIAGALWYMFDSLGQEADAARKFREFRDQMNLAILDDLKKPAESWVPRQLGDQQSDGVGDYWTDWECRRAP